MIELVDFTVYYATIESIKSLCIIIVIASA